MSKNFNPARLTKKPWKWEGLTITPKLRVSDFWLLMRFQPQWAFILDAGEARILRGQVPTAFLRESQRLSQDLALGRMVILALQRNHGLQLRCPGLSEGLEQRFRNLWQLSKA